MPLHRALHPHWLTFILQGLPNDAPSPTNHPPYTINVDFFSVSFNIFHVPNSGAIFQMQMTNSLKRFLINCESSQKFAVTHKIKSISSIPHIPIVCSATPLSVPRNRCFTVSDGRPLSIPGDTDGRLSRVNAPNIAHRKFKEEYKYKIHTMQIIGVRHFTKPDCLGSTFWESPLMPPWSHPAALGFRFEIHTNWKRGKGKVQPPSNSLSQTVWRIFWKKREETGSRSRWNLGDFYPDKEEEAVLQLSVGGCPMIGNCTHLLLFLSFCFFLLYFVFLHFEYARGSWVR